MMSFMLIVLPLAAFANRYTVKLTTAELSTVSPQDTTLGNYYMAEVNVPEIPKGAELFGAFLELIVDVSSRDVNGFTNDTPIFEVYALDAEPGSELDPSKFRTPSSMRRNIRVGEGRRVRIDIIDVVKEFMEDSSCNHGLVLGSLSNTRDGLFTIKSSEGTVGTITYYYLTGE